MTALSLYGVGVAATTLPNAAAMVTSSGSPATSTQPCTLNAATGWGEIVPRGTTVAWGSFATPSYPTGKGFIWDAATLDNQQLIGGTWSLPLNLNVPLGVAVTADILVRVFAWQANHMGYIYLSSMLLPGQVITASTLFITLTGNIPTYNVGAGDRLYFDVWANVTNNPNSGSATIGLVLPTTSTGDATRFAVTTGGYVPSTPAQLVMGYSFGGFPLNDGVNYFLLSKQQDTVPVKQGFHKAARYDGVYITGEIQDERQLQVTLLVVADSRINLENKLGALRIGMSFRQQPLTLHANDNRTYTADCVGMKVQYKSQVSAQVSLAFVAQKPWAYTSALSYTDSGNASLVGGTTTSWQRGPFNIYNPGEATAFPTVTITNNTSYDTFTLNQALVSGTNYTTINITGLVQTIPSGGFIFISQGGNTAQLTLSAQATAGATSVSVVSWLANANYTSGVATFVEFTNINAVTLTNNTDGRSVTFSGLVPQFLGGENFVIVCDPNSANGYTGILNGGSPLTFAGIFPQLESGTTSWTLVFSTISPAIVPVLQTVFTWKPTWLA